jgi:hypothetical protein
MRGSPSSACRSGWRHTPGGSTPCLSRTRLWARPTGSRSAVRRWYREQVEVVRRAVADPAVAMSDRKPARARGLAVKLRGWSPRKSKSQTLQYGAIRRHVAVGARRFVSAEQRQRPSWRTTSDRQRSEKRVRARTSDTVTLPQPHAENLRLTIQCRPNRLVPQVRLPGRTGPPPTKERHRRCPEC